jgi:hypothetical protein
MPDQPETLIAARSGSRLFGAPALLTMPRVVEAEEEREARE